MCAPTVSNQTAGFAVRSGLVDDTLEAVGRMEVDKETLWREYSALPVGARQLVMELIAFLATRAKPRALARKATGDLADDPFVGMWRDREDLADSHAWVRTVREREWRTHRG